jgi:hypothetical protein
MMWRPAMPAHEKARVSFLPAQSFDNGLKAHFGFPVNP